MPLKLTPGQIWLDHQYYLDAHDQYKRKFILILANGPGSGDLIAVALTSKSHGLRENPPCDHGPPRSGFFIGILGGPMQLNTWADFSNFEDVDDQLVDRRLASGRYASTPTVLPKANFVALLRCAMQCDDLTKRQRQWLQNSVGAIGQ